ncbi:TetR/AcrR family transcriptional regulator [Streptomyces hoynatensis]|uniref:TetR/AcrR family transcriptional regulator n=1 Tax=Streptomyces hoynatensis TaxID=1141874 RepID=A0A3A9YRM5_9ACTN|nr:TetR/AcrR family transcriptional regulator [Streptomyces hoynatensis]RKN38595.1 TetR/AcrR family transcriptional regulator [Streptomyces hoynatensis]
MAGTRTDGRVERGNQTRRLVLGRTMDIASVEGLDGLSIGRIALDLGLSKSGVFALFGSKEELQLATIRAARSVFVRRIVDPVEAAPPGLGRIRLLCEGYLDYSRGRTFPGGCFFAAVAAEFSSRRGAVHDAVAAARAEWVGYVTHLAEEARRVGELRPDVHVPQLAFELLALLEMANTQSVLHDDDTGYDLAAAGIAARLDAAAAGPAARGADSRGA